MPVLSKRIVLDCFYLLIFYFEKFSTAVCRLQCAVNVNLNLSNISCIRPGLTCLWTPFHSNDCKIRYIFEKNGCCSLLPTQEKGIEIGRYFVSELR